MEEQLVRFTIEYEQEEDGRWLAEVIELPGVLAYGRTPEDAMAKAQALGLRVLADRIEHGEEAPALMSLSFVVA
jgi:predicted RNase H-like HicB family nuclease